LRPPTNQKQFKITYGNIKQMTTYKLKNLIFYLLLVSIFFTSCSGQNATNHTSNNTSSTTKKEQHPKIVRTMGTQNENVGCQLLDKDGNVWFSIRGEGVYRYDGKSFTNFTTKDGLCNNNVGAIIQDREGNILIGTKNGICIYDGNKFTKYPVPETLSITCMLEDKDGNLWFGAMNKGIYRFDGKTLDNFLNNNDAVFNLGSKTQLILDMLQDKNGNIWFSSWNGGGVWRYDGKEFKNFLPSEDYYKANQDNRNFKNPQNTFGISQNPSYSPSQDHITDDMIFSMTEDNSGNIWFATRNHGICYYNGKIFTSIAINEGFDSGGATAILQDDKNNFWITTWDQGVWYYDGKTFENFTENDGLVGNAVMSVLEDKDGNIWFGTKWFGLSRYDGKNFTTFSQ
jgi:ligand-binding sensor domain-containing protein